MNFNLILSIYSFRSELKILVVTFFIVVFILPILVVTVLTQTGIQMVSDALIKAIPGSAAVQLIQNGLEIQGPFYWPVSPDHTSLEFGEVDLPYQPFHTGIDLAGKSGEYITPFMAGSVIYAGEIGWGYGKHIIVDHGLGLTSLYAHLDKINVQAGDEVGPGKEIGGRGNTGWSTGPHLHFEVRVAGIPVNPREFLGY